MILTNQILDTYYTHCELQKQLNKKTMKAYRIDLKQFQSFTDLKEINAAELNSYIQTMHQKFRPNTVKRKIASLHAFFQYAYLNDMIAQNPMDKIQTSFRQTKKLPRTISLGQLEPFFHQLYIKKEKATTAYQKFCSIRDIAIFECLLGTGMRISELCHIKYENINFHEKYIRIIGKGDKERILQIGNTTLYEAFVAYQMLRQQYDTNHDYFFINKGKNRLSEQSVRDRIIKICQELCIDEHITPHMFRHTFATLLLEEDIDIRYIQHILGHSSITTTQIYTHIRSTKQADILNNKNPRNFIKV